MDKAQVRKQMRALKAALAPEEKLRRSEVVMHEVEQRPEFVEAQVVLVYWSMSDEVQTHAFVERWYRQKTLLLPCVDGDELRLRQYTGPACMVAGEQFGIGEPTGPEYTELQSIDLIIVPGVAFDRQNNRMGRGRGFYDRLLEKTPDAYKIGVAYGFQVTEEIPVEPFDIRMNLVISD